MKNKIKIGFIGCGNMARAMIESMTNPSSVAALKSNGVKFEITASNRTEGKLLPLKGLCNITLDNRVAANCDYVVLAVKPQNAEDALSSLDLKQKVIISIMAGVSVDRLKALTGSDKIVRVMPNLCARVGESFNPYAAEGLTDGENEIVQMILGSFGAFAEVSEDKLDAVTGISGGGPAYVFMFLRALVRSAEARGFSHDTAKQMAIQTVVGSALTFEASDDGLDEMIKSVCSPGGTTIEAVNCLNDGGFEKLINNAIDRAIAKSEKLKNEKR